MYRILATSVVTLACVLSHSGSALAHHSVAANFDLSRNTEVVGRITEILIRNPHSQITLEIEKPGGGVTEFFIEWSDKNALIRRNVPVGLLKVGDVIAVTVSPSRRLPNLGYFRTATLPDGFVLRDCGFTAFREAIAKGKTGCEENAP